MSEFAGFDNSDHPGTYDTAAAGNKISGSFDVSVLFVSLGTLFSCPPFCLPNSTKPDGISGLTGRQARNTASSADWDVLNR